tara:strand:+ start:399 stop:728 length:330 start_codon:yes stop_codon:yes gene_type:complete
MYLLNHNLRKIVNKIKEKKLNSIKSQIFEITDLAGSIFEDTTKKTFINKRNYIENKEKDTFILTKIVNSSPKSTNPLDDISFIKDELNIVKLMLSKQEKIIELILLRIK